jgi:hypothetical protein
MFNHTTSNGFSGHAELLLNRSHSYSTIHVGNLMAERIAGVIAGLPVAFPDFVPLIFALAIPANTRSRMMERSNSEKTDNMPNIALPDDVVVSNPCCWRNNSTLVSWR